jgi:hypothetical protein
MDFVRRQHRCEAAPALLGDLPSDAWRGLRSRNSAKITSTRFLAPPSPGNCSEYRRTTVLGMMLPIGGNLVLGAIVLERFTGRWPAGNGQRIRCAYCRQLQALRAGTRKCLPLLLIGPGHAGGRSLASDISVNKQTVKTCVIFSARCDFI